MVSVQDNGSNLIPPAKFPAANEEIRLLNSLLRREMSAAATYDRAIDRIRRRWAADKLRSIRNDHLAAASKLSDRVLAQGGAPVESPGVWGIFANTVAEIALTLRGWRVFGALRCGEHRGESDYRRAARAPLSVETRRLIKNDLLPKCTHHVVDLDDVEATLGQPVK